jgi:transaldolase
VLGDGISVNVTLIFSLDRYRAVMDAFLTGLEQAAAAGHDLPRSRRSPRSSSAGSTPRSTRLDKIGPEALALQGQGRDRQRPARLRGLRGGLAGERWQALAAEGRAAQRPLWASTGVKDPAYDDTMYVVDLVAPDTVNTMPEKTLDAVADHGQVTGDTIRPRATPRPTPPSTQLAAVGIDLDDVVKVLEDEGVEKFEAAWERAARAVAKPLAEARAPAGR